jgi:hypothetical protein
MSACFVFLRARWIGVCFAIFSLCGILDLVCGEGEHCASDSELACFDLDKANSGKLGLGDPFSETEDHSSKANSQKIKNREKTKFLQGSELGCDVDLSFDVFSSLKSSRILSTWVFHEREARKIWQLTGVLEHAPPKCGDIVGRFSCGLGYGEWVVRDFERTKGV